MDDSIVLDGLEGIIICVLLFLVMRFNLKNHMLFWFLEYYTMIDFIHLHINFSFQCFSGAAYSVSALGWIDPFLNSIS